jgi:hypothetical protein
MATQAANGSGSGTSGRPAAAVSTALPTVNLVKPKARTSPNQASARGAAAGSDSAALSPTGASVSTAISRGQGKSDVLGSAVKLVPIPMLPAVDPCPTSLAAGLHGARSQTFGSFGGLTLVKGGFTQAGLRSPTPLSRKIQLGGKAPSTANASVAAFTVLSAPPPQLPADKPAPAPAAADPARQTATAAHGAVADLPSRLHASPKRASPQRSSSKHSPLPRSSPRRSAGMPARLSDHFKSVKPMAGGFKFTLGGGVR